MNRTVKIALLTVVGVPVALITAVLVWFGTVAIANSYKLGWIEVPVRYRLTFGVEVAGVAYTGSTVVQVTYEQIPAWQNLIGPGIAALYHGQAGLLKLPDGKVVCLMPRAANIVVGKHYYSVVAIAGRLLSVNGSPTGPKQKWPTIGASNAATVTGESEIPVELLPPMVVLDDPANPSSAHLFDPEHPERTLGAGARFIGAQIAVTNASVSHDIEAALPWLADPAIPQMLNHPGDAYLQDNPGHPLFKADFY
jgi:hypothetical protein